MAASPSDTAVLLRRWHEGDRGALAAILERELPWLREHIERRLGPLLQRRGTTEDFVQQGVVQILQYGPRFVVASRAQFRALLARMLTNMLREEHRFATAGRRDVRREQHLTSRSTLDLDSAVRPVTRASEVAAAHEAVAWVRMGLELLGSDDRQAILLRDFEELPFADIGARLGITEKAARMRYVRALPRLADTVRALQRGELARVLAERERAEEA